MMGRRKQESDCFFFYYCAIFTGIPCRSPCEGERHPGDNNMDLKISIIPEVTNKAREIRSWDSSVF